MKQQAAPPKKKKKKPSSKAQQSSSAGLTFLLILMIVILLLVILLSDPKEGKPSGSETADKGTAAWQEEDLPGNKKPSDQEADAEQEDESDENEIRLPQKDEVSIQKGEDGYKIPEIVQSTAPDFTPPPPSETTQTTTQQQQQQTQQSQQTQQQQQQPQTPPPPPPFVPRTIGSGSFRSSTGVNLNLVTKWSCTTTDSGNASLKLDFYVESYTIYAAACPAALTITAYGATSALDMPDLSLETSALTQTHVGSKNYNISITDGNTATVPIAVKWYFGGVYSGVDLSVIESSADLFLSR